MMVSVIEITNTVRTRPEITPWRARFAGTGARGFSWVIWLKRASCGMVPSRVARINMQQHRNCELTCQQGWAALSNPGTSHRWAIHAAPGTLLTLQS